MFFSPEERNIYSIENISEFAAPEEPYMKNESLVNFGLLLFFNNLK
jgi:hypothetical protein